MALTQIKTAGIADDAVTQDKVANDDYMYKTVTK